MLFSICFTFTEIIAELSALLVGKARDMNISMITEMHL
jgi:hypothetical protein